MAKQILDKTQKISYFLSRNIKKLIEKSGVTINQLSKNTGLSFTTLKRIIDNQEVNPTLSSLETISNYFNISIAELIGEATFNTNTPVLLRRSNWNLIPLIKQEDVINWPTNKPDLLETGFIKSVSTDSDLSNDAYAITAIGSSMEPAIPEKSTLIIDPEGSLENLSFVIVFKTGTSIPQIKQLLIDGPDKYLKTLNTEISGNSCIPLTPDTYRIVGVVKEIILKL